MGWEQRALRPLRMHSGWYSTPHRRCLPVWAYCQKTVRLGIHGECFHSATAHSLVNHPPLRILSLSTSDTIYLLIAIFPPTSHTMSHTFLKLPSITPTSPLGTSSWHDVLECLPSFYHTDGIVPEVLVVSDIQLRAFARKSDWNTEVLCE